MCAKQWKSYHSDIWRNLSWDSNGFVLHERCPDPDSGWILDVSSVSVLRTDEVSGSFTQGSVSSWLPPLRGWLCQPTLCQRAVMTAREFGVKNSIWSHPRQNRQARAMLSIDALTVGKDQCHTGFDGPAVYRSIWRKLFFSLVVTFECWNYILVVIQLLLHKIPKEYFI